MSAVLLILPFTSSSPTSLHLSFVFDICNILCNILQFVLLLGNTFPTFLFCCLPISPHFSPSFLPSPLPLYLLSLGSCVLPFSCIPVCCVFPQLMACFSFNLLLFTFFFHPNIIRHNELAKKAFQSCLWHLMFICISGYIISYFHSCKSTCINFVFTIIF